MDKVIFENLKLKEHIQQLKTRTEGESALLLEARRERDILAKQVKSLEEEVSHLTSQLAAKDAQATKSAKHFTELDEELKSRTQHISKLERDLQEAKNKIHNPELHGETKSLRESNERLKKCIMQVISHMVETLNAIDAEETTMDCNGLEEALELYSHYLMSYALHRHTHFTSFVKVATDLPSVVKALEQVLRVERVPIPHPPQVGENNIVDYMKQLVYTLQGVCASKGRFVDKTVQDSPQEVPQKRVKTHPSAPIKTERSNPEFEYCKLIGDDIPLVPMKAEDPSPHRMPKRGYAPANGY